MNNERPQPPALATWLLRRLCSKQNEEVLTGDLIERFGDGGTVTCSRCAAVPESCVQVDKYAPDG